MNEETPPPPTIIAPPQDLSEEYMMASAETADVRSFLQLYFKLLFVIRKGIVMLSDEHQELKDEAIKLLEDADTYFGKRQMEYEKEDDTYQLGSKETGMINVRKEDIAAGQEEAREQQSSGLIRKLHAMDIKIAQALKEEGVIEVKKTTMEDALIEGMIMQAQTPSEKYELVTDEETEKEEKKQTENEIDIDEYPDDDAS